MGLLFFTHPHAHPCCLCPREYSFISYFSLCFVFFFGGQAFTELQKKRLLSWKQQVQKLFRSFPRKSLLELSGYRQQRRYVGFWEGRDGCSGQSTSGDNASQKEGWVLLPSEPCLGRGEGWESFRSVLVRVVTAFPSDPTLSPWLQASPSQLCSISSTLGSFPAAL